jgi:hypothetical protein
MNDLLSQSLYRILLYDITKPADGTHLARAVSADRPAEAFPAKAPSARRQKGKGVAADRRGGADGQRWRQGARKLFRATAAAFLAGIVLGHLQKAIDRRDLLHDAQPLPPRPVEPPRINVAATTASQTSSQVPVQVRIEPPAPEPDVTQIAQPVAILNPLARLRAERLVARGEQIVAGGNIALARQLFLRAADAGLARGAFLLATTYDGRELLRLRMSGVQPNPTLARRWYERARALGAAEAEGRLGGLGEN